MLWTQGHSRGAKLSSSHSSQGVILGARHPQTTALATARQEERPQLLRSPCPSWTPNTLGSPHLGPSFHPGPSPKGRGVEPRFTGHHNTRPPGRHGLGPRASLPGSGLSAQCSPAPLKASPISKSSRQAPENPASASATSPTPGHECRQRFLKRASLLPLPCSHYKAAG